MNLNYTPEEQAFREEVRSFVHERLPADIRRKVLEHKRRQGGLRALAEDPARAGLDRTGLAEGIRRHRLDAVQRHIFDEECAAAGTPRMMPVRPEHGRRR